MRTLIYLSIVLTFTWAGENPVHTLENQSADSQDSDSFIEIEHPQMSLAVLPLYHPSDFQEPGLKVDSLLLDEILNNNLAQSSAEFDAGLWDWSDEILCLSESCLEQYSSTLSLSHLLIWDLYEEEGQLRLFLALYDLNTTQLVTDSLFSISDEQQIAERSIRRAIRYILDASQPSGIAQDRDLDGWLSWFKAAENQIFVSSVGFIAIVTWIVLQSDDEESIPPGIGNPPDWPGN